MKFSGKIWAIVALLGLGMGTVQAADGPDLKFDPESVPATGSKPPAVYGEKDLLKWGNDNRYFKLGGYGSIRFEADSAEGIPDTFTFRRFVLTTDAKIASRFRIYAEIEFERFRKIELERTVTEQDGGLSVKQEIEGTNKTELAIEQAWFELEFAKYIRLQGGGVLVPVGRFNINHDDNAWTLPRRPLVDRGVPVLPTTSAWDELGFGLNGDIALGEKAKMDYRIYVVNGVVLDAEVEEIIASRDPQRDQVQLAAEFGISTGTFSQDVKDAKAVTGRVAFSPAIGHEIGISGYWGRYTPDYMTGENLTILGFDWLSTFGAFEVEAEYIYTNFGNLDNVLASFANVVGQSQAQVDAEDSPDLETKISFQPSQMVESKQGYWVELRYRLRPKWLTGSWFGRHFSDPQLIPVVRWEQAFLHGLVTDFAAVNGNITNLVKENRFVNRGTVGLGFRLNPLAIFQIAYEYTWTNSGQPLAEVTNYLPTTSDRNHSFMLGAAFGF